MPRNHILIGTLPVIWRCFLVQRALTTNVITTLPQFAFQSMTLRATALAAVLAP
ncbi:hypothetical protein HYE68_000498 [Fusarium pseudograminearum]|nr:hypothetical protein HYE68_000498 [Fusarium pseudograminearum]